MAIFKQQFEMAVSTFTKNMAKFFPDMQQDSYRLTDEVGYKKSEFVAKGPRP